MQADAHAQIEKGIADYTRGAWRAMRRNPVRQLLRIARRRARETAPASSPQVTIRTGADRRELAVPHSLRPPSYFYRGFTGPWLEEYFFQQREHVTPDGAEYLPIFFDGIFFHAQCHAYWPGEFRARYRLLWSILDAAAHTDRAFFTLLGMYEFPIWEWHLFPRNVAVFAAAGFGDIPIPLLKGSRPLIQRPQDIRVSFMGALDGPSDRFGVRSHMKAVFGDVAHFGSGPDWEDVMARSVFSLCPRGQGPTSFRLFEALSVTSIPIFIWRERCWLPDADEIDWSSISLCVEASQLAEAKQTVLSMPAERIAAMQAQITKLYPRYFTYDAACANIRRRASRLTERKNVEALAARREFTPA